jgi:hypothetical protein
MIILRNNTKVRLKSHNWKLCFSSGHPTSVPVRLFGGQGTGMQLTLTGVQ